MATYRVQASTTGYHEGNNEAKEITPANCCCCYFCSIIFSVLVPLFLLSIVSIGGDESCYLQLFANSVSISNSNTNANVSTADWSIGFTATSQVTGCKISLHRIKSSLLRGQEVIAESSPSSDLFGQFVASYETEWPVTTLGFSKVITPEVIDDVVWNIRVDIVAGINKDVKYGNGISMEKKYYLNKLLMVSCGDIPVKFTADSTGNLTGSLLGNMRRCDYKILDTLDT